jgi:hypothetical protein
MADESWAMGTGEDTWLTDDLGDDNFANNCDCCTEIEICDDFEGDLSLWTSTSNVSIVSDPDGGDNALDANTTGGAGGGDASMSFAPDLTDWRIDGYIWVVDNGSTGNGGTGFAAYTSVGIMIAFVINGVGEVHVYNNPGGTGAGWTNTGITRSLETWHSCTMIRVSDTQTTIHAGGFIGTYDNDNDGKLDQTHIFTQNGGDGYADDICTTGTPI